MSKLLDTEENQEPERRKPKNAPIVFKERMKANLQQQVDGEKSSILLSKFLSDLYASAGWTFVLPSITVFMEAFGSIYRTSKLHLSVSISIISALSPPFNYSDIADPAGSHRPTKIIIFWNEDLKKDNSIYFYRHGSSYRDGRRYSNIVIPPQTNHTEARF